MIVWSIWIFIHAFYLTVAYKLRELYPFFIDW